MRHITLSRHTLLDPLKRIVTLIERSQTLPILGHVLLDAQPGGLLTLTATDLELQLQVAVAASANEPWCTTVPGRRLLDIVRSLPADADIELRASNGTVGVVSGRSRFRLQGFPAEDFPVLAAGEGAALTLPADVLRRLVGLTQHAMAVNDVRHYLNGLYLMLGDGTLRAVAADGHRLAQAWGEVESAARWAVIVPRKAATLLPGLLDGADAITLRMLANTDGEPVMAQLQVGGAVLTAKLVDGRFPDWRRAIPDRLSYRARVPLAALRAAVSRVALITRGLFGLVSLCWDREAVELRAEGDGEEGTDAVGCEYDGPAMTLGVRAEYLLGALDAIEGEEVVIGMEDPTVALLIEPVAEDARQQCVVMPVRL